MEREPFRLRVECYSGYRGEETPRSFRMGERRVQVAEILDRWFSPDHRYFKIRGDDEGIYILRHDMESAVWDLTFFQDGSSPSPLKSDLL